MFRKSNFPVNTVSMKYLIVLIRYIEYNDAEMWISVHIDRFDYRNNNTEASQNVLLLYVVELIDIKVFGLLCVKTFDFIVHEYN